MFLTFEGMEGCGKSTQCKKLIEHYVRQGHDVLHTREPGGSRLGKDLRKILLDLKNSDICPTSELFLYLADRAQHLFLPTVVLTLISAASMSRIQRNLMLDSLGADYVRTARAKGLTRRKAVTKHALRTALIPTGTYVAFTVATMFVGATFTERIFNFQGMGMYAVDAITQQNINGVAAVTAFAGVCTLVGAILADILVAILDPRVRLQ